MIKLGLLALVKRCICNERRWVWFIPYKFHIFVLAMQSRAVLTRSNITWYCTHHCGDCERIWIRMWTHKRHSTPRPDGRAMGRLLWGSWRNWSCYNGTILYFVVFRGVCVERHTCTSTISQNGVWAVAIINTLKPRPNDGHFADDTLKRIFFIGKNIAFQFKFHLNMFPKANSQYGNIGSDNGLPSLISHYLIQSGLVYWCIYASIGLNELPVLIQMFT